MRRGWRRRRCVCVCERERERVRERGKERERDVERERERGVVSSLMSGVRMPAGGGGEGLRARACCMCAALSLCVGATRKPLAKLTGPVCAVPHRVIAAPKECRIAHWLCPASGHIAGARLAGRCGPGGVAARRSRHTTEGAHRRNPCRITRTPHAATQGEARDSAPRAFAAGSFVARTRRCYAARRAAPDVFERRGVTGIKMFEQLGCRECVRR